MQNRDCCDGSGHCSEQTVCPSKLPDDAAKAVIPLQFLQKCNCAEKTLGQRPSVVADDTKERKTGFDEDDYIVGACCDCLHYRSAALVVGALETVVIVTCIVGQYLLDTSLDGKDGDLRLSLTWKIIIAVSLLALVLLLFIGVLTEKPFLLWPHMVGQIIGIVVALVLTLVSVFVMSAGEEMSQIVFGVFFGDDHIPRLEFYLGPIWPFCLAVIFNFSAAIGILFYSIIRGCYDYLHQKMIIGRTCDNVNSPPLLVFSLPRSATALFKIHSTTKSDEHREDH